MSYARTLRLPSFLDEANDVLISGYRDRWTDRVDDLVEAIATQPDADERWEAARRSCLERYEYRCAVCARPANTVHHIFPRWWFLGGSNSQMNLVAVCPECHPSLEWRRQRLTAVLALLRMKGRPAQRPWSPDAPHRVSARCSRRRRLAGPPLLRHSASSPPVPAKSPLPRPGERGFTSIPSGDEHAR